MKFQNDYDWVGFLLCYTEPLKKVTLLDLSGHHGFVNHNSSLFICSTLNLVNIAGFSEAI